MAFVCFAILKAVLTRLLFAGHCLITVCRVVDVYNGDGRYWMLLSALGLLLIESVVTLGKRKGRELKWFCPSFLIFLCGVVPGIWFLELDRLDRYRTHNIVNSTEDMEVITGVTDLYDVNTASYTYGVTINETETTPSDKTDVFSTEKPLIGNVTLNSIDTNGVNTETLFNVTDMVNKTDDFTISSTAESDILTRKRRELIHIPAGLTKLAKLDPDMWVNSIEQSMLLLLIIGRWLLPKGDITRDQLSQLLFVYIGMASDIMELYHLYEEPDVVKNELISIIILAVWSLSLFQFTLVLTTARKPRVAMRHAEDEDGCGCNCCGNCSVFGSEIWSIMVMVFFQDGPFLAVRLYVTVTFKLFSYNIIFFTAKNALIVLLQFYRFVVIVCHEMRRMEEESYAAYSCKMSEIDSSHENLTEVHAMEANVKNKLVKHGKKNHKVPRK